MSLQSLQSEAQLQVDLSGTLPVDISHIEMMPLEVSDPHEHHEESHHQHAHQSMEVAEPGEVSIVIEELPGAPADSKDPEEPVMEVLEEPGPNAVDDNEAKKSKKDPKWDWEAHGPTGFIAWVKSRCDDVPKHSGQDTAGLERAIAYLDRLDGEISRAMRMDLDGELDANQIEKVRAMIDDGVARLHDRLDKVKKVKKTKRSKKKAEIEIDNILVKEAQKITGVQGIFVTVDLLTSRIARVCINGMVSAGHDLDDLFDRQVKYYGLDRGQKAAAMQLLSDMGYALRQDRGIPPDEDLHVEDSDNFDFAANYKG